MKKLILTAAAVGAALAVVAGCAESTAQADQKGLKLAQYEDVTVWVDPDTKCQYVLWDGYKAGSMVPRVHPNGLPVCGR